MTELKFINKRDINANNYKELPPVYIKQMEISATLGFGPDYATAEAFLEQCGDGDVEETFIELWDVVDSSNPDKALYDCWVYLVDTANVFYAGTDNETGVGMCQSYFENIGGIEGGDDLAKALQKAFHETFSK